MSVDTQEIDFNSLVLGLSTAALSYLGYDNAGRCEQVNKRALDLAAQNIGIIAMLQEKTKGNLSHDESKLIGELLCDLRLKYVEASKQKKN